MVKSGLVDDPRVSHLRLTAHLGIAVAIFACMFWVAMDLLRPSNSQSTRTASPSLARSALALAGVVFLMILTGGLVAGIRAGYAYNTFPLMNGQWIPSEIFMVDPWYVNFFNNMATVQFDHRLIAWILAAWAPMLLWRVLRESLSPRARAAAVLLVAALAIQISLGIATLLLVVPVPLAASHQGGAILVFAASLYLAHTLRRHVAPVPAA
jgi:cytochrome c oxidase assembly protein subunit 15